ncbi:MAG: zinc ribbon domain-containing protein [Firmicutes bacterium]|nr:zinc ribbon domain-containing protein [Bacillota bacterium]MBQ9604689.1 zinc ribbon domain-containing protein [Bacillota bacterium]
MFCEKCGNKLDEGAKFCSACGAETSYNAAANEKPVRAKKQTKPGAPIGENFAEHGTKVTENIYLCTDGKYRWVYEFSMLKNPTILITVWKVLLLSFGIVYLIMLFFLLLDGIDKEGFLSLTGGFAAITGFFLFLGVIAYLIVAGQYGWKYMVLFTMDEEGVEHRQMQAQFDKAKAMGWLTVAAGIAAGKPAMVGLGLNNATRSSMSSSFAYVRKVKAVKRRNVIYVNELLDKNQIYAAKEDFDFVLDYILARVPDKAKK